MTNQSSGDTLTQEAPKQALEKLNPNSNSDCEQNPSTQETIDDANNSRPEKPGLYNTASDIFPFKLDNVLTSPKINEIQTGFKSLFNTISNKAAAAATLATTKSAEITGKAQSNQNIVNAFKIPMNFLQDFDEMNKQFIQEQEQLRHQQKLELEKELKQGSETRHKHGVKSSKLDQYDDSDEEDSSADVDDDWVDQMHHQLITDNSNETASDGHCDTAGSSRKNQESSNEREIPALDSSKQDWEQELQKELGLS